MGFCDEVVKLRQEEEGATTVTATGTAPPRGAYVKGFVKVPTIEELDWELSGVVVQLWELQDKLRNTRIAIFILVLLAILARAYGY